MSAYEDSEVGGISCWDGMSRKTTTSRGLVNVKRQSVMRALYPRPVKEFKEAAGEAVERRSHSYIYSMLNPDSVKPQARVFKVLMSAFVLTFVLMYCISSCTVSLFFDIFEMFGVCVFFIEYVVRVVVVTESRSYRHPVTGRLRYMRSWHALLDLFGFLPFFLQAFAFWTTDTRSSYFFSNRLADRSLSHLCVLVILRMPRLLTGTNPVTEGLCVLGRVIRHNWEVVGLSVALWLGVLLIMATLLFASRPRVADANIAYPDIFSMIPYVIDGTVPQIPDTTLSPSQSRDESRPVKVLIASGFNTLLLSAMMSIPTAMLTWAFQAEAHRQETASVNHRLSTVVDDSSEDDDDYFDQATTYGGGSRYGGTELNSLLGDPGNSTHETGPSSTEIMKAILSEIRTLQTKVTKMERLMAANAQNPPKEPTGGPSGVAESDERPRGIRGVRFNESNKTINPLPFPRPAP